MLTLLTTVGPALIGLLTSFLPNLVKYFERKQDNRHEMELIRLKMEAASLGLDHQRIINDAKTTVEEGKSLRDHDIALDGGSWINRLRAAIRPLLTLFIFVFFVSIKIAVAWIMISNGAPAENVLNVVWDQYTNAMFGAIVGFWFGTRAMLHTIDQYAKLEKK